MSTPFQDDVRDALLKRLNEKGVSEELVHYLGEAFSAEKLPTAEEVAAEIKDQSGDKLA